MHTVGPPHLKIPFCGLKCLKPWLVESMDVKPGDMRADFIEKSPWISEHSKFKPMLFRVKNQSCLINIKKLRSPFFHELSASFSWITAPLLFYCCYPFILCRITYLYLKLLYPLDKSVLYYVMSFKVNIFDINLAKLFYG